MFGWLKRMRESPKQLEPPAAERASSNLYARPKEATAKAYLDHYGDEEQALLHAVSGGQAAVVREFIDSGVHLPSHLPDGTPLLQRAANIEVVRLLLEAGADPNSRNERGESSLFVRPCDEPELVELLVQHGGDLNARDELGWTPLMHIAVQSGVDVGIAFEGPFLFFESENPDVALLVETFLRLGADPNARTDIGDTALMLAARSLNTECVKLLLSYGADPSARNEEGEGALDVAGEIIDFSPDVSVNYPEAHKQRQQLLKILAEASDKAHGGPLREL